MTGERAVLWIREDGSGAEWCALQLSDERLTATGVQLGGAPLPYRLDYRLETWPGFATRELRLRAAGAGWSRLLTLRHSEAGRWEVSGQAEGGAPLAQFGGPASDLDAAADCDLGFSPLTNTLPVRRLRLLDRAGADEAVLAAWVRVPDLSVVPLAQRYLARASGRLRYEAGSFATELTVDADGVLVSYPGLAHQVPAVTAPR
jgi:hypothetical protein